MELRQIEKTGTNEVKLTIAVTAEEFGRAVDAAIREKGKTLTVHGFRKGKAPKALIEKAYGREFFYQDAVNETYGVAYDMAVAEAKIVPVDRAEIALVDCSEEGYTLTATVTVKPEVSVKKYKGIKADKLAVTVSDAQVEGELAVMLERNARIIEVEDRPAQNGDQAEIDFEGFKDGVPFEGGKGEHFDLELGSGQFIPGFEDQVCGHNAGEEFDVNVSFPEDYPAEELKGAAVVFKCKLHSIKAKEMPVADDDFAKDVSEFDTIDELKADIKAKILEKEEAQAEAALEEKLVDAILENMEAEIPECMYEARMEDIAADFEARLQRQTGLSLEEYIKYTGADKETFFAGFRPQAERQVKIRLALEEIAKLEKIEMTEEEMNEEFKTLAERYEMKEDQVRKIVPAEELALDLCVEKAIKFVRDNAKVTEVTAEEAAAKEEAPKKKRTTKKKVEEEAPA
ncbi:MAG: trigger factor, partial [Oscillospiraceae bacterium]|nr:trigger factor [Oscillospiraceae bacterium]